MNMLLIRPKLFNIIKLEEILNHNAFPLLQESDLCFSHTNNFGG